MQACEDKLVDKTRVRTWFDNVKISDKAFKEWPNCYHELLNEYERDEILSYIQSFTEMHVNNIVKQTNKSLFVHLIEEMKEEVNVPSNPITLMAKVYRDVFPVVHHELAMWKERAYHIPNDELHSQAIASIEHKTFHCEGGGILALLANEHREECIRFIVAYQTISDYLDNLCDRSTSLDPNDFAALHESMLMALSPEVEGGGNYYRYRDDQDDGGYLDELVETCQDVLKKTKHYDKIAPVLHELACYYCDLQIHKHVKLEERERD